MEEIDSRRLYAAEMIKKLRKKLSVTEKIVTNKACVYATGSFGRSEAGKFSDLDLFIVGKNSHKLGVGGFKISRLSHLDEICVFADLIRVSKDLGIPDFDGDGRYLVHRSVDEFTRTLGMPEDDVNNTFTGRLLLLLESKPLLGAATYNYAIRKVIKEYWGDFEGHENDFNPAFLANDILRLWRTLCINYEVRTERQPEGKKIKRSIKNFKLKHSRLLTCYSALIYLLHVYRVNGTVSPKDAFQMSKMSPIGRLEWLKDQPSQSASSKDAISNLLAQYNHFLRVTSVGEEALIALFGNKDTRKTYMKEASSFGDTMFEVMNSIGDGSPFHRLLVV